MLQGCRQCEVVDMFVDTYLHVRQFMCVVLITVVHTCTTVIEMLHCAQHTPTSSSMCNLRPQTRLHRSTAINLMKLEGSANYIFCSIDDYKGRH